MEFRHFHYFVAVADAGSFSAAAERLHVSQPALSARLKDLEDEFSVKLFLRHPRGVELTQAGRRLLPYAREIQEAVRRAKNALGEASRQPILLGITPTLGLFVLPTLLEVCADDGGGKLVVQQASSGTLLGLLAKGKLDAVISFAVSSRETERVDPLFEEDFVLVGRADMIDGADGDIEFDHLRQIPMVVEPLGHLVRDQIEEVAAQRGISLTIAAEVEPLAAKLSVLLRSDVCAVVPKWVFSDELRSGALQARRICNPPMTQTLSLTSRRAFPQEEIAGLHRAACRAVGRLSVLHGHLRLRNEAAAE